MNPLESYLKSCDKIFRYYKSLGDKTFAQLSDDDFFYSATEENNSIAVIVQHMSGNMLSRFTDFLTADGEKEWRHRDREFASVIKTAEEMHTAWEKGWACFFNAFDPLTVDDLSRTVKIRKEDHSVVEALNRQMSHYAYHVGQIVDLGKAIKKSEWQSLSIPRGQSNDFNKMMDEKAK